MPMTFRDEKGEDLEAPEIDANFRIIVGRLDDLEGSPPEAVSIADITVESNNVLTFIMTDATTRGPFLLPYAKWNPKGEWEAGVNYFQGDVVENNGAAFLVRVNHTSDSEFDPAADHGDGFLYRVALRRPNLPFEIDFFQQGIPGAGLDSSDSGTAIFTYRCARSFWLPAGLTESVAGLERSAATQLVFPIMKNRVQIGTLTIGGADSESESEGEAESDVVWDFPAAVQFDPDDRLRILDSGIVDTNAFDLSITIVAQQGTAP